MSEICKACDRDLCPEEITELDGYCVECFDLDIPKRDKRIAELESKLATEIADWAETDTHVRNTARPVLGVWVDGDSDSVPSVEDIVERLVHLFCENTTTRKGQRR